MELTVRDGRREQEGRGGKEGGERQAEGEEENNEQRQHGVVGWAKVMSAIYIFQRGNEEEPCAQLVLPPKNFFEPGRRPSARVS